MVKTIFYPIGRFLFALIKKIWIIFDLLAVFTDTFAFLDWKNICFQSILSLSAVKKRHTIRPLLHLVLTTWAAVSWFKAEDTIWDNKPTDGIKVSAVTSAQRANKDSRTVSSNPATFLILMSGSGRSVHKRFSPTVTSRF